MRKGRTSEGDDWISDIVQSNLFKLVKPEVTNISYHKALKNIMIPRTYEEWSKISKQKNLPESLSEGLKEWMASVSGSFAQYNSALLEVIVADLYEKI